MGVFGPYRPALVLALPVGTIAGSIVGLSITLNALLAGAGLSALYFLAVGALIGLSAATIAVAGGAAAALLLRNPRYSSSFRRAAIVIVAGLVVFATTFLVGVVALGYGDQAGGTYLWTWAAVLLALITIICATLLTSAPVARLSTRQSPTG